MKPIDLVISQAPFPVLSVQNLILKVYVPTVWLAAVDRVRTIGFGIGIGKVVGVN